VSPFVFLSQSRAETPKFLGRISAWELDPQPWCFTDISLGLPHAHSFSICLFSGVCVVCVCFLLYVSIYLCFAHCVFSCLFHIHYHFVCFCFVCVFSNSICTYVTVPIDILIDLPMCLSFCSTVSSFLRV